MRISLDIIKKTSAKRKLITWKRSKLSGEHWEIIGMPLGNRRAIVGGAAGNQMETIGKHLKDRWGIIEYRRKVVGRSWDKHRKSSEGRRSIVGKSPEHRRATVGNSFEII